MFKMFSQLFATIALFFAAAEKVAAAANHLGTWSEEQAGAFADEARIQRAQKLAVLKADLAKAEKTAGKEALKVA